MVKHCCTAKKEELETESLLVTYEDNQFVMENRLKSKSNEEFQGNIEAWLLYYNILDVIGAIELAKQH
jgi:hypothetical protein